MATMLTALGNTVEAVDAGSNLIAVKVDGAAITTVGTLGTPVAIWLYEEVWGQWVLAHQVGTSAPVTNRSDDRGATWT